VRRRVALLVLLALGGAACGESTERSTGTFCTRLQDNVALLEGPLSTPEDLAALVTRYRELERVAPLSVEAAWATVTDLIEASAAVDRDDPDAVRTLADQAYATDQAAREVATWVAERCGFTLPRVPAG